MFWRVFFGFISGYSLCKSSRKWRTKIIFEFYWRIYRVFLGYLSKIVYFSVYFVNYFNLSQFKFWKNLCTFWRKLFFTWNNVCKFFWTFIRYVFNVWIVFFFFPDSSNVIFFFFFIYRITQGSCIILKKKAGGKYVFYLYFYI